MDAKTMADRQDELDLALLACHGIEDLYQIVAEGVALERGDALDGD